MICRRRAMMVGLALSAFGLAAPAALHAQELALKGPDGQTAALSSADIAAAPHVALTVTIESRTFAFRGVPLTDLLARVGAPTGALLRGKAMADAVIVTARDGYVVVLGLAETDPMVRREQVILADQEGGAPLPDGVGPYRLVVEGDERGARDARMVTSIEVRRLQPAAPVP
jgi:hypothetical protein